jgi:Papain family cysteine protease
MNAKPIYALTLMAIIVSTLSAGAQTSGVPQTTQLGKIRVLPVPVPRGLETQLAKKRQFKPEVLQKSVFYRNRIPILRLRDGKQVALVPVEEKAVPPEQYSLPQPIPFPNPYITYKRPIKRIPNPNILRFIWAMQHVDHRPCQTPIRDQGDRGTCTAFASVAGIEAWEKCHKNATLDLSEQHAYEITLKEVGGTCSSDPGTVTYYTAKYLTDHHICTEVEWPYQSSIAGCSDTIPAQCSNNSPYGFTNTEVILGTGFGGTAGQSANDPAFLQNILYGGYDIVFGIYVAGTDWNDGTAETGVVDVQQQNGAPAPAYGGHAMLMVGYNSVDGYFIFKNSWNTTHGHAGYFYLSNDYITTYGKYGYVVKGASD